MTIPGQFGQAEAARQAGRGRRISAKFVWTCARSEPVGSAAHLVTGVLILLLALAGNDAVVWAQAPLPAMAVVAAPPETDASSVRLLVGRSTVLDVGSEISRVSLTSAEVADAMVTSPSQLLINGKLPGTISMFVWDRRGSLRRYEVVVQRDLARLSEQMRELFPGEQIAVHSNGKNVVLSGVVTNKDVIEKAVSVAAGYVDKRDEVTALLQLQVGAPSNQVLLRVRFAEVSRSAMTELGASFFTSPLGVKNTIGRVTTQQFTAPGFDGLKYSKEGTPDSPWHDFGKDVATAEGQFTFSDFLNLFLFNEKYDLGMMVRALKNKGLFQSLAEPNLVAESGKEASFLAGGEFPIPIAQGSGANIGVSVVFKEFGIRLSFTPTVTGDRVHLKVRPEVSALDFNNSIVLSGFRIPALTTRRTETEIELQNGQTFAIAGLLSNTMTSALSKIPGIGDIPILGYLFKSKAAQKNQTELVVMITADILPNGSRGVTPNMPRLSEPYLPPPLPSRTLESPPPAFGAVAPSRQPDTAVIQPDTAVIRSTPAPPAPLSPASAAAAVSALTPAGPRIVQLAEPESAVVAAPVPAVTRPMTPTERRTVERARREEQRKAAEANKAQARADKRAKEEEAKRVAAERRAAAKESERLVKLAREQGKRDAEAATQRREAAKQQAERDRERQQAVDKAAARLEAAEAAYEAEVDRTK